MSLTKASDIVKAPVRDAGGDNEVPRDSKDRPRIAVPCDACGKAGSVPSPKTGRPIKCPKCRGGDYTDKYGAYAPKGHQLVSYTRTTTFIDVLEDKSSLMAWGERMVLIGVANDGKLTNDVLALHEVASERVAPCDHTGDDRRRMERGDCESCDAKAAKDELNRKAQIAKKKAGAEEKADKGSALHGLSELQDMGEDLPKGISFEDFADLDAYRTISAPFKHVHMEKLVVHDKLRVAGTPDRVSTVDREWVIAHRDEDGPWGVEPQTGTTYLVAPDGSKVYDYEEIITDLKTGTTEYGALKMCMQLADYAGSELYDPKTAKRTPLSKVNPRWGIIFNVPAGTGTGTAYWADLTLGTRALYLAAEVRKIRSLGRNALTAFATPRAA